MVAHTCNNSTVDLRQENGYLVKHQEKGGNKEGAGKGKKRGREGLKDLEERKENNSIILM